MPLKTQIQAICADLPIANHYLFGTAKEINLSADSVDAGNDPYICHYPMSPVGVILGVNGSVSNTFDLYIEFLYITKFEKDTDDNDPLINQAIAVANKFLVSLRDYRDPASEGERYFSWDPFTQAKLMPIYNKFDVNTCGVSLMFKVKTRKDPYLLDC